MTQPKILSLAVPWAMIQLGWLPSYEEHQDRLWQSVLDYWEAKE